jgi:hypothetical protein
MSEPRLPARLRHSSKRGLAYPLNALRDVVMDDRLANEPERVLFNCYVACGLARSPTLKLIS